MSEFKKRLQQDLMMPAEQNRRLNKAVAVVKECNEKNNTCSIEFVDKDGIKSNKDNVLVRLSMPGFIGWFPKIGEIVNIEIESDDEIEIVSPYGRGYEVNKRPSTELKKDIFSGSFGDTMGGFIF